MVIIHQHPSTFMALRAVVITHHHENNDNNDGITATTIKKKKVKVTRITVGGRPTWETDTSTEEDVAAGGGKFIDYPQIICKCKIILKNRNESGGFGCGEG